MTEIYSPGLQPKAQAAPQLGVCYYPEHWPEDQWESDARRMIESGLSVVRIGEFAWSRLEPEEGSFDWDWLTRSIDCLKSAGLQVILGTPSATPPNWMVKKYPDMLAVDTTGQARTFGSRRHYCFSHSLYRQQAARMAGEMAKRFGQQVDGWQIDNEYGCHDTVLSYSLAAREEFRLWLSQKYQSPDALNRAWGNVFWSMDYNSFDDIDLPNQTVTEPNPAHVLDFRRFSSAMVYRFHQAQVAAIRPYSKAPIIHNFMGKFTDFDPFTFEEDLDIASWDSYPLGFLERAFEDESWKNRFYRQGDPDFQAFHHDLYRAVGKGRWWVMEQQPGPVNWARYNPVPLPGMVRLWTWEAIAHGAQAVCYFRWRQYPRAQEQMHAGLLLPDAQDAPGLQEVKQTADEIAHCPFMLTSQPADVAIVFDYQSQWAWEVQPQGQSFDYFRLVFDFYRSLRQLGLSIDFIPANCSDFGPRKLVLIPGLMAWNADILQAIDQFEGFILAGPRTGSKTSDMGIPTPLPPNMPGIDASITRVASLRPGISIPLAKGPLEKGGAVINWQEEMTSSTILERDMTGAPVLVGHKKRRYLGAWLDDEARKRLLREMAAEAGIPTCDMPEGVRQRHMKDSTLVVNYNATSAHFNGQTLDPADCLLIPRL